MIDEEAVEKQFMSYCRKILKCEKIDYYRERKYRAEQEVHLEMLGDCETEMLMQTFDTYRIDSFEIMGHDIGIDNECLDNALRKLSEKHRRIILMYYFIGLNDVEIGKIFRRSRSTICAQRHDAMKRLRKLMEGTDNE